ncbi:MAG TPA: TetR/AcrR family transcriptional regulator [Bacillota bacterium]|nr:TetR/AcrR family transcriptional regulator [Bacillota bacterium]
MKISSRREKERTAHEAEIVAAAEKVFIAKGFEAASIDEIAKAAQFTRRTVYQYFANKEELYFAVILKGFRMLFTYFETAVAPEETGFVKCRQTGLAYYRFYQEHPELFRLMNLIGHIRPKMESAQKYSEFMEFDNQLFQAMSQIIREGQADGSIKPDLNAGQVTYSLIFTLTGFLYELSISGQTFTRHFMLDEEDFVQASLRLVFQSIQA